MMTKMAVINLSRMSQLQNKSKVTSLLRLLNHKYRRQMHNLIRSRRKSLKRSLVFNALCARTLYYFSSLCLRVQSLETDHKCPRFYLRQTTIHGSLSSVVVSLILFAL